MQAGQLDIAFDYWGIEAVGILIDKKRKLRPEERLNLAILEQAALDISYPRRSSVRRAKLLALWAREWVNEIHPMPYPLGSFQYTCEVLDLDPSAVRVTLLRQDSPVRGRRPPVVNHRQRMESC